MAALAPAPTSPASPSHLSTRFWGRHRAPRRDEPRRADSSTSTRALRRPDDVRNRLGLPCLGMVPKFSHLAVIADPREHEEAPHREVMEAYRRVPHSTCCSATPDVEMTSLVITSARPGEGKSCTAANLAVALASSEKRVLRSMPTCETPAYTACSQAARLGALSDLIVQPKASPMARLLSLHATDFANLSLLTSGTFRPIRQSCRSPSAPGQSYGARRGAGPVVIDTPPRAWSATRSGSPPMLRRRSLSSRLARPRIARCCGHPFPSRRGCERCWRRPQESSGRSLRRSYYGSRYSRYPYVAMSSRESDPSSRIGHERG